jgi:uncharacterized protein (DUF2236 family)
MAVASPALGALDPDVSLPFGPGSIVRAVVANPVTSLLVQRVLVMDIAHPKVAAAVSHHSDFRTRPLTRAFATADAALRLVFGGEDVARGAARQVYGVHDRVHGDDPTEVASRRQPADVARYTAHDAALLTWVWATLVEAAELAFTRWVRPFSDEEALRFYNEMRAFARFFGIPENHLPPDRRAGASYLDSMLGHDWMGSSGESRQLARHILWFRHRNVPPPVVRVERALALATLDERLSRRLGLDAAVQERAHGERLDGWLRAHYSRFPQPPSSWPALYLLLRQPARFRRP